MNRILDLNTFELLKEAKKVKSNHEETLKLAVLGSDSMQFITSSLPLVMDYLGKNVEIYEAPYNGIQSSILDPGSNFYEFNADISIIIPALDKEDYIPFSPDNPDEITKWIDSQVSNWELLWDKILEHNPNQMIVQANYVITNQRSLGQLESLVDYSEQSIMQKLNKEIINKMPKNVELLDLDSLANNLGKNKWFDHQSYYLSKAPFHIDFYPEVLFEIGKILERKFNSSKKVLVLDLDNTLWGGVIGDLGSSGIDLDPNSPLGEAFRDFQRYILKLYKQGVLLAVASKNDLEIAKSGFKNPYMILEEKMISVFKANWNPKSDNIKEIAEELSLGLNSFVFFDDNPFERNIVKTMLPMVEVIDVPEDPSLYVEALDKSLAFNRGSLTSEDLKRNQSYSQNKEREKMQQKFSTYDEYLESLDMSFKVEEINDSNIERFTQLTNKSNQFNLRTQRYKDHEIENLLKNENYKLFGINLSDKLSQYGMIACVILKKDGSSCFIENWVMSCRVLKRGVENITMNTIYEKAQAFSCETIVGEYIETDRNSMVSDLLLNYGLHEESGKYKIELDEYKVKESYIRRVSLDD